MTYAYWGVMTVDIRTILTDQPDLWISPTFTHLPSLPGEKLRTFCG